MTNRRRRADSSSLRTPTTGASRPGGGGRAGEPHRLTEWYENTDGALGIYRLALILAAAQSVALLVRLAAGDPLPGWLLYIGPVVGAALWPGVSWLLLAPQRRLEREHTI